MWRVDSPQGCAWLKVHSQDRKYRQEVQGRLGLGAALRRQGVTTPELWGHSESQRAVLMGHVTGTPVTQHALEGGSVDSVFRQAGEIAQLIHSTPFDDADEMPLNQALNRRARAWAERTRGTLTDPQRQALVEHCAAHHFNDARRFICHRDFSTRNWLVQDRGTLALIHFEHVHADLWLTDLPRPTVDLADWPRCETAFLEGYGRPMTPQQQDWRSRLHGFLALTSLA